MTCIKVKVARPPIIGCLQCPLCNKLVHEATTISECLHTFCRSCIYQHLGDNDNDSCPICNVSLGCSPLEKLRADHQLDDIRAKIFPVKPKIKLEHNDNIDVDATSPIRRKERSLSSLGIGAAPSNSGYATRRAKSISRRAKDRSSDEETGEKNTGKLGMRKTSRGSVEECSSDVKMHSDSEYSQENDALMKGDTSDEENYDEPYSVQASKRQPGKKVMLPQLMHEHSRTPRFRASEASERMPNKRHTYDDRDIKPPKLFSGLKDNCDDLLNQSPLAQLAEVAVDEARNIDSFRASKCRGPRSQRVKRKKGAAKSSAAGGTLSWQMMLEHLRGAVLQQNKKQKTSVPSPISTSTLAAKKQLLLKSSSTNKNSDTTDGVSKQDSGSSGFWFSLEAADNQLGGNALPQISARYLRIRDGKLPVSAVRKYLVSKLSLQSENEVELTCRGQPVVPNLPLERVQNIWMASSPTLKMLHQLKEINAAALDDKNWTQHEGKSAREFMMVLTYARHRR